MSRRTISDICHQKEVYEKFFVTNKGYINGPLPEWQQHPMWER